LSASIYFYYYHRFDASSGGVISPRDQPNIQCAGTDMVYQIHCIHLYLYLKSTTSNDVID